MSPMDKTFEVSGVIASGKLIDSCLASGVSDEIDEGSSLAGRTFEAAICSFGENSASASAGVTSSQLSSNAVFINSGVEGMGVGGSGVDSLVVGWQAVKRSMELIAMMIENDFRILPFVL